MQRRLATVLALITLSCAGSETQDVLLARAGTSESSADGGGGNSTGTPSGNPNVPGGNSSGGLEVGTCEDANREEEPNDGRQDANVLRPTRCGTLSRDDQKDFVRFRLKAETREMFLNFAGDVRLRVDVRGETTVEITPEGGPSIPFVPNEDYSVEITALENNRADSTPWRLELVER